MRWEIIGPSLTTGGLTTLLVLLAESRSRRATVAKTDAEADKIRTETYQLIVSDLRGELDRIRAASADAEARVRDLSVDLVEARTALGQIRAWAVVMSEWAETHATRLAAAGGSVDPVPSLEIGATSA